MAHAFIWRTAIWGVTLRFFLVFIDESTPKRSHRTGDCFNIRLEWHHFTCGPRYVYSEHAICDCQLTLRSTLLSHGFVARRRNYSYSTSSAMANICRSKLGHDLDVTRPWYWPSGASLSLHAT